MPAWSHCDTYEFSSYSDVLNNAMHVYGPPIPPMEAFYTSDHTSENDYTSDQIPLEVSLYPCMKFTCPGTIDKLMFVASVLPRASGAEWPLFALWKRCDDDYCVNYNSPEWVEVKRFSTVTIPYQRSLGSRNRVAVYEVRFTDDSSFDNGQFLGVYHSVPDSSTPIGRMTVLHQNSGGKCDAVSTQWQESPENGHRYAYDNEASHHNPIIPYIAIEASGQTIYCIQ